MRFLHAIFGDPNEKELKKIYPIIDSINALESSFVSLSDEQLQSKTTEFKKRHTDGESLDDLLPEAFATVRETARRVLGQRHYDVQLIGGIALHQGKIAEMKTGEGKTLTATTAIYLNALEGKGVHVVTVNDYLARRDCAWMGQIFHFLGMSVGCIQQQLTTYVYDSTVKRDESDNADESIKSFRVDIDNLRKVPHRREAYACDITYGTNNEFGFDYLRDNMVENRQEMSQRGLRFAIVDEVDSILIDEARTPLIISAPDAESTDRYYTFARVMSDMREQEHYNIDEKMRSASFTEAGQDVIASRIGFDPWEKMDFETTFHLEAALKAQALYKRDRDYVVQGDEVVIVDEFTGRLMFGRRYSEGLHQALEAKEGVPIQKESKTLATITFQNLFRMYDKLGGMTGTAVTEAEEFHKIYNLEVLSIPTNRKIQRVDHNDLIYKDEQAKFAAVIRDVKERQQKGQPILIGTISIEKNELLSQLLDQAGVPHKVLNAKNHEKEADIIAQAGRKGAVTLATNMAGRGVDIILGGNPQDVAEAEEVRSLGGLYVLGTERHEARRIDNQLRGRCGRQGDPGESRFYVSLDDDLMRIFGSGRIKSVMETLKVPEDMPIENTFISKSLEKAQQKVEGNNFDIRKHLVEYDDVINKHRQVIYGKRREILDLGEFDEQGGELKARLFEYIEAEIEHVVLFHTSSDNEGEWDMKEIYEVIGTIFPIEQRERVQLEDMSAAAGSKLADIESRTRIIEYLMSLAERAYQQIKENIGAPDFLRAVTKSVLLRSIDSMWVKHLEAINHLRAGIGLRGYGQRDPLVEYKKESFRLFNYLMSEIQRQIVYSFFKIGVVHHAAPGLIDQAKVFHGASKEMKEGGEDVTLNSVSRSTAPQFSDVGRNDPCPCGSGKKFKKCHGA